jgi:pimeloyl-ACP methyl ester carboxylesterase
MSALLAILAVGLMGPVVDPTEFRAWFDASTRDELTVPPSVAARAREFRYVFVGGFRGEGMRDQFGKTTRDLRARGVPKKAIHVLSPSSHKTVEENAVALRDEFEALAKSGPERIVVIAHSRGACDTLAFALENAEFVDRRIEAFFLVQGPFGGSGLADYVMGEGPAVDDALSAVPRTLARLIGGFERMMVGRGKHGGLASMTRERSRTFWGEAIDAHPEAVAVLGSKTFYIEGETEAKRLRLFLRATAAYLTLHYGPNDGVVARGDQSLPALGTSLGVFDVGHSDLTRNNPGSRAGKRSRKAMMDAIVMAVGRPAS